MISCDICVVGFIDEANWCVHMRKLIIKREDLYRRQIASLSKRLESSEKDLLDVGALHKSEMVGLIYDSKILEHRYEVLRQTTLKILAGVDLGEDLTKYVNEARAELLELERSGYIPINLRKKEKENG